LTPVFAAGVLLCILGLLGLWLGLFAPWRDILGRDGSAETRLNASVQATWYLTNGGAGCLALGIGSLLFALIGVSPDRSLRLRIWKVCLWAGIALLPGPVVGWAGSAIISRHVLESIRLPVPGEPEPEHYNRYTQPLVASVLGVVAGAIGAVVVSLSLWQIQTLRRAQAEDSVRRGSWT
jgi:hypothetical protein